MSPMSEPQAGDGISATRGQGHSSWAPPRDKLSLPLKKTTDTFPRKEEGIEREKPLSPPPPAWCQSLSNIL